MSLPFTALRVKDYPTMSVTATGSYLVTTTENAQRFVPMFLHLEVISMTGNLLTSPSFSLGTTSGGSDILAPTTPTLALLNGANKLTQTNILAAGAQSLPPGSPIWLNISAAALGPTAMVVRPDLVGYYV